MGRRRIKVILNVDISDGHLPDVVARDIYDTIMESLQPTDEEFKADPDELWRLAGLPDFEEGE